MWGSTLASSIPKIGKFTDVRVESSTDTTLTIAWDFIGNFARFRVHYTEVGGATVNSSYLTEKTTVLIGLTSGKSYDIYVRAEYSDQLLFSDTIRATTNVLAPSPATNLNTTNVTDNSLTLNWTVGANTGNMRAQYRKFGDTTWIQSQYIGVVSSTNYSSLAAGTKYEFRVKSENNGLVAYSEIIAETTVILQPSPVTNLFANNVTANSALINWTVGANTQRLRVYYSEDNFTFLSSNYISDVNNVNTYQLNNLKEGKKYYVYIKSENQGYNAFSATIDFTTITLQPTKATLLAATDITDTSFKANWNIGANTTRVRLYWSEDNVTFITGNYITDVQNIKSYVVDALKTGTLYYYKLRSENNGIAVFSDTKTVTTTTTTVLPSPAKNLNVTGITETSMVLNWTVGANTDRLRVEWSKNNSTWVLGNFITNLAVNSYNISPLINGTKYYLRIRSERGAQVIFSNTITETTLIDKTISTENLSSYYPLNETSGDAIDTVGGANLALYGGIVRNGSFYSFDGSTGYMRDSAVATIGKHVFVDANENDTPFTVRMSVKFDNFKDTWLMSRRQTSEVCEYEMLIENEILYIILYEKTNRYKYISRGFNISGLSTSKFYRVGFRYMGNYLRSGLSIFIDGNRVDNIDNGSSSYRGMEMTLADTQFAAPQFSVVSKFKLSADMRKIYVNKGGVLSDNEMMWDFEQNL